MKKLFAAMLALIMAFSFTACKSEKADADAVDFAKAVYEARVKYVGNASDVMNLIDTLHLKYQTAYCSIELQTETEPYELTLNFSEYISDAAQFEKRVKNYACVLLATIQNLSQVNWRYDVNGKEFSGKLTEREADKMAGKKIKSVYSSSAELLALMVKLDIVNEDGTEIKIQNKPVVIGSSDASGSDT